MPRNNAENQRRFRERNAVTLTASAAEIAEKLIDMKDQKKLREIRRLISNHLKNHSDGHGLDEVGLGYDVQE